MKKIIMLVIPLLLLCGCEQNKENEYSEGTYYIGDRFTLFVDKETCVEYYVSNGSYNAGNVLPRFDQDGALKLNKDCLTNLESEVN